MMIKVFLAILETFIAFGCGALAWKLKMLDQRDLDRMTVLTLDFLFPLLTFATIVRNVNRSQFSEMWQIMVLGFALMVVGALIGGVLKHAMWNVETKRQNTFHHLCATNNYVFLPLIVLAGIWGEKHVAMLLVMNVGSTIGFWTIGIMTLSGGGLIKSFRNVISINLIAIIIALTVVACNITIPLPIVNASKMLGDIAVPLMLLLIGAALFQNFRTLLSNQFDAWYMSVVRLVLIPLALIYLLKLLPLPETVYQVCFVVALMPVSSSSVLVARRYGGCPEFAGQAIIITTLLSLLTIPLLLSLL